LALAKRIATRATFVQKASFTKIVIARAFAWMWIISRVKLALVDAWETVKFYPRVNSRGHEKIGLTCVTLFRRTPPRFVTFKFL
jgi:hypothetical protein